MTFKKITIRLPLQVVSAMTVCWLVLASAVFAKDSYYRLVRNFELYQQGIPNPSGVVYSPAANSFLVVPSSGKEFFEFSFIANKTGTVELPVSIPDPLNMAFDLKTNSLFFFDNQNQKLVEIKTRSNGHPDLTSDSVTRYDAQPFSIKNARGMTFDPENGDLYLLVVSLTNAVPMIVHISPDKQSRYDGLQAHQQGRVSTIILDLLIGSDVRGIAFNPVDKFLYIFDQSTQMLYAINPSGDIQSTRDLSAFSFPNVQNMIFAPSGDQTDHPETQSLYIAYQGHSNSARPGAKSRSMPAIEATSGTGDVVELSLNAPVSMDLSSLASFGDLVNTIYTSDWSPPSPDPSGGTYIAHLNHLFVSDGEVNEMPIFTGVNMWEVTFSGGQIEEYPTTSFCDEPTGVAYNPDNNHLYFTDDTGTRSIYDLDPGPDGQYMTGDDNVTSISTNEYGSGDPEGITYDLSTGHLFVADGVNSEIYEISPDANGIFGPGYSVVNSFDTQRLGVTDPEGVEYNPDQNTLYIVGKSDGYDFVLETTPDGRDLSVIDISVANATKPAGLVYAPNSLDPSIKSLYVIARGVDNNSDPKENDGRIYEFSLGSATPSVFIDDVVVTEGNSGTVEVLFTVSLSSVSQQQVTVDYSTIDGTATTADNDYNWASGQLTFSSGETVQTLSVTVIGDLIDEPDETFYVNLSNISGANMGDDQGLATIRNDDGPQPTNFSFQDGLNGYNGTRDTYVQAETPDANYGGDNSLAVDGSPDQAALVYWDLSNISAGSIIKTSEITLNITNRSNDAYEIYDLKQSWSEYEVTWNQRLSGQSWQIAGADGSLDRGGTSLGSVIANTSGISTFTLNADGVAVIQSWIDDPSLNHGFIFQNYTSASNGMDFSSRESSTVGDRPMLTLSLEEKSGSQPRISINDVTAMEGDNGSVTVQFTVILSVAGSQTITVDYATADGSATVADNDYVATSGQLSFDPGVTSQTVTVAVNGDRIDEPDETFVVNLSNAVNATLNDAQGSCTITDDDNLPALSIDDVTLTEGDSGTADAVLTVSLSAASSQTITVDYATADGSATVDDNDYVATFGQLSFDPAMTSQTVTVAINGDQTDEVNETFVINLSNAVNASLSDAQGTCTITDDDGAPALSINDITVTEGNSGTVDALFSVTLSPASSQVVTADYATADGSATVADNDYIAASGQVSFNPGVTIQSVTVAVNGDLIDEPDETFVMNLSNAVNATLSDAQGTATITDDDSAPSLSIDDVTVTEGNTGTVDALFTITLSSISSQIVTVDYASADGTATVADNDYQAVSGQVSLDPGVTSQSVSVTVNGDETDEPDETFVIDLSNVVNATLADGQGTGTIANDDNAQQQETLSFQDGVAGYMGTRETQLSEKNPDVNFGSTTEIEMDGQPKSSTLIYWDLSYIPLKSIIHSAEVTLNLTDASGHFYDFYQVLRPWSETDASWNQAIIGESWQNSGANGSLDRGSVILTSINGGKGPSTVSLNSDGLEVIQNWVNDPASNFGFIILNYTDAKNNLIFTSREGELVSEHPKITITFSKESQLAKGSPFIAKKPGEGSTESTRIDSSKAFTIQNYPNPFNLHTRIEYVLPKDAWVKLSIFNTRGRVVTTLVDEYQSAGSRIVTWDGRMANGLTLGSGIYFIQCSIGNKRFVNKMILQK